MEENNTKSFFDNLEDDVIQSSQTTDGTSFADEIGAKVIDILTKNADEYNKKQWFRESASVESYRKRGFIKEGELVADPMSLFFNKAEKVKVADGRLLICRENGDCSHRAIYITEEGVPSSVDDIEKQLITALTALSDKFNESGVMIYAFAHFYEREVRKIVPTDYVEFKGCYQFINMPQGWMMFRHHRAVRLSEESES